MPSAAQAAGYRAWTDALARGIGDSPVAITLQADGPFALCAPGGSQAYSSLIRYSAQKLGALPNAAVYIDAGAEDWLGGDVEEALRLLIPAGVEYVRGFSMNNTHYNSTELEVAFGAEVVEALAARGIKDKHFVVNTSSNGRPFPGSTYAGKGHFDNADLCRSADDTHLRHPGHPADDPRRRSGVGHVEVEPAECGHVRGRLHVDRPSVAVHAGRPVRPAAGPAAGPHLALREVRRRLRTAIT